MPSSYRPRSSRRPKGKSTKQKKMMKRKPYRKNTPLKKSVEKKVFDSTQISTAFAQTNTAGISGHNYATPTLSIANGTAVNERIGNKILLTGARMDMEFVGQASQTNAVKYRWYLIRLPQQGSSQLSGDPTDEFLDQNPFAAGIYDWHSAIDHERSQSFKVVATGTGRLIPDSIAGQTSRTQLRKYLKLGHIVKYDNDVSQTIVENSYRLIFLADSGDTTAATGIQVKMNIRWYYLDN